MTAPVDLCHGTGVEVQPTPDGPTYAACTGCTGCGPDARQRGRDHYRRRADRAAGPFALIPTPPGDAPW